MSEEIKVEDDKVIEDPVVTEEDDAVVKTEDDIESIVNERLAKMKANMDRMASERDDALKAKAEVEKAKKEAEMERLREEGKVQEVLEMQLAEANAKLEVFEKETTSLRRDGVVNGALTGLDFRNDKSREMARREIVDELVQSEDGVWLHKSGTSIKDFIESYATSEDNSFLFRVKSNSGAGTSTPSGAPDTSASKSIGELSTQEILALASKGKLGNFNI